MILCIASWTSSGKICGRTHHACGRSSYSTSSTGLFISANRLSTSRHPPISWSAVPTRISVLGQDALKVTKAPDTSGSERATPESPRYKFATISPLDGSITSPLAFALASSFGGKIASGAMGTTPRGGSRSDCKMRWVNTIAVRHCQSSVPMGERRRTDHDSPQRCPQQ